MAILKFSVAGQPCQYALKDGLNRLGRNPENDQTVADPSVSGTHCEVILNGRNLVLRDLGSTNGTYVKSQKVNEALIDPGETFRIGNVDMTFTLTEDGAVQGSAQSALPRPITPPSTAPSLRVGSVRISTTESQAAAAAPDSTATAHAQSPSGHCATHAMLPALYSCTGCGRDLCAQCVSNEKVGPKTFQFCSICKAKCVKYGQPIAPQAVIIPKFGDVAGKAFKYPFKGNGLILLVTGTIFFGFLDVLTSSRAAIMFVGFGSLLVKVLMYGYMFAYMQRIVVSSSDGEEEPPGWPDVTDIGSDIVHPFLMWVATFCVAFGPGYALSMYQSLPGMLLIGLGMIYFPMALLMVCMTDSLSGLNPLIVISSILKVPGAYFLAALIFGGLVVVRTLLPDIVREMGPAFLSSFLRTAIALILLTIEMRILGLLYYTNKKRLAWF